MCFEKDFDINVISIIDYQINNLMSPKICTFHHLLSVADHFASCEIENNDFVRLYHLCPGTQHHNINPFNNSIGASHPERDFQGKWPPCEYDLLKVAKHLACTEVVISLRSLTTTKQHEE